MVQLCGLDSAVSGYHSAVDYCGHGNKPSVSYKKCDPARWCSGNALDLHSEGARFKYMSRRGHPY
jgi:hypothetical protein